VTVTGSEVSTGTEGATKSGLPRDDAIRDWVKIRETRCRMIPDLATLVADKSKRTIVV